MHIPALSSGKYIIAVSGGIDSVVLLHYLQKLPDLQLIVAHVDHGIRHNSSKDATFVANLAQQYGLMYEEIRYELGARSSEDKARQARYEFLHKIRQKHQAQAVITAHHANDVVETMMINLMRGTGWRGLCSLKNTHDLVRPLLSFKKADIIKYAQQHNLKWKEDSTNEDDKYLRNRIRKYLLPRADIDAWISLYLAQCHLQQDINTEVQKINTIKRYQFIMWPKAVALEVLKNNLQATRPQAEYALLKIKTAKPGTVCEVGSGKKLRFTRDSFVIK